MTASFNRGPSRSLRQLHGQGNSFVWVKVPIGCLIRVLRGVVAWECTVGRLDEQR